MNGLIDLIHSNLQALHADPAYQSTDDSVGTPTMESMDLEDALTRRRPSATNQAAVLKRTIKYFAETLSYLAEWKLKATVSDSLEEQDRRRSVEVEDTLTAVRAWL